VEADEPFLPHLGTTVFTLFRRDVGDVGGRLPLELTMATGPSYSKQLLGSLIAAAIIVVLAIAIVTAKIGPGLDARELHDIGRDDRSGEDNSGPG
jgi:hypothetical protein